MIRYPTINEVLQLHKSIINQSGGSHGIRDLGLLDSALNKIRQTFGDKELFPTLLDKAAALGYSLIANHPFIDGNKRIGHAAMELLLYLNGYKIEAPTDEQEKIVLGVASGELSQADFTNWLRSRVVKNDSIDFLIK